MGFARGVATGLFALAMTGCTSGGQKAPMLPMRETPRGTITPNELVSLIEGLADSYVGTIVAAANEIQGEHPPALIRDRTQRIKVFVGTTAYAMATRPNPQVALIDLVVNITVQHEIWKRGLANLQLGDRAAPILQAYDQIEPQAWATLRRVFSDEQLALLGDAIQRWLDDHPHFASLPFVDLPALSPYRNLSLLDKPAGSVLLAPITEAATAAMELQLLGERALYFGQRFPYLAQWQVEAAMFTGLSTPEAHQLLDSTRMFASSADRIAAVLGELPASESFEKAAGELTKTAEQAGALLTRMQGVMAGLNQAIDGTDQLLAPFQTPVPAVGGGPPERRFEVGKYTDGLRELNGTVRELNELLAKTQALVASPDLRERLDQAGSAADRGLGKVSEQGNRFLDRLFWRGAALIGVFFVALLLYRLTARALDRRLSRSDRS